MASPNPNHIYGISYLYSNTTHFQKLSTLPSLPALPFDLLFKATERFYPFHVTSPLHYSGSYGQPFCKSFSCSAMPCMLVSLPCLLSLLCFCPRGSLSSIHNFSFILSACCFPAPSPYCQTSTFSCLESISMWMSNVCFKSGKSKIICIFPLKQKKNQCNKQTKPRSCLHGDSSCLVNEMPRNHSSSVRPKL